MPPGRRFYSGTVHMKNKKHSLQLVSSLTTVFDHLSKNNRKLSLILYSIDVRVSSPPFQGFPFLHATEYIKEGEFKHQKAQKNFPSSSSDALTTESY